MTTRDLRRARPGHGGLAADHVPGRQARTRPYLQLRRDPVRLRRSSPRTRSNPAGPATCPPRRSTTRRASRSRRRTETPDGNMDVTMAFYNSRRLGDPGLQLLLRRRGARPLSLVSVTARRRVPYQTGYVYDDDGPRDQAGHLQRRDRQVRDRHQLRRRLGPPSPRLPAATPATTYTNGDGQTTYLYQYHSATAPSHAARARVGNTSLQARTRLPTPTTQRRAARDHRRRRRQAMVLHRTTWRGPDQPTTPDAGTTTSTYDHDGNLLSATNADGKPISYAYDADGRKTYEYAATSRQPVDRSDEARGLGVRHPRRRACRPRSTSYVGGASGTAYAQAVAGYKPPACPRAPS